MQLYKYIVVAGVHACSCTVRTRAGVKLSCIIIVCYSMLAATLCQKRKKECEAKTLKHCVGLIHGYTLPQTLSELVALCRDSIRDIQYQKLYLSTMDAHNYKHSAFVFKKLALNQVFLTLCTYIVACHQQ